MPGVTRRSALTAMAAGAAAGALPVLPGLSHAAPQRAPLRLTIVNLMPWAGNDARGQPVGALIDLCGQLAALAGMPITPMLVPYGRAPYMLNSGGTELMLAIDTSSSSSSAIEYVGTVDIVVLGRSGFRYQRLDDLFGRTVGTLRHSGYSPGLEAEARIRKHAFDSYDQGLRMLQAGRLDAVMGVDNSIAHALGNAAGQFSPRYPMARGRVALYADARIGADAIAALQAACRQLRQKGAMDELLQRYQRR
ncbi:ABC-type amino acid transport substrate-binding protein [Duganella sp. 1224]|uniref:substrate-binding periplasmic protein n=1 Tax=Duganella sp. 1224 TaxID=2587052 RepID=UPI0015C6BFF9|nr:transporter substrate-binding domain-containing protein [Duganella sp. 1224]NYE61612.1 ABC-type amino acid transport substrate-binding protein [Duganella sp. 1224]